MDDGAIERARERVEQRADATAVDSLLERARMNLEALVAAADDAAAGLPDRLDDAVRTGLREQVAPVARNIAEIRGLMNQVIRRLDRVERDAVAERHAHVDDLALLVDLISSGWKDVDARLGRIESTVTRFEHGLQEPGSAIVYRIEDRRADQLAAPDAASEGRIGDVVDAGRTRS
jgi:hypothetical protein